jgi:hypothetical protein
MRILFCIDIGRAETLSNIVLKGLSCHSQESQMLREVNGAGGSHL